MVCFDGAPRGEWQCKKCSIWSVQPDERQRNKGASLRGSGGSFRTPWTPARGRTRWCPTQKAHQRRPGELGPLAGRLGGAAAPAEAVCARAARCRPWRAARARGPPPPRRATTALLAAAFVLLPLRAASACLLPWRLLGRLEVWRLVTAPLAHTSSLHLALSLAGFVPLGSQLERGMGTARVSGPPLLRAAGNWAATRRCSPRSPCCRGSFLPCSGAALAPAGPACPPLTTAPRPRSLPTSWRCWWRSKPPFT